MVEYVTCYPWDNEFNGCGHGHVTHFLKLLAPIISMESVKLGILNVVCLSIPRSYSGVLGHA